MLNTDPKCRLILIISLLSLSLAQGIAYGTTITVEAKADAGQSPDESAYIRFLNAANNQVLNEVNYSLTPMWDNKSPVYSYASSYAPWSLNSAGNIWSTDTIVGESLEDLTAGTYRISPQSGAYMYDSWGWSDYRSKYWWELHIQVNQPDQTGGILSSYYMLGSNQGYDTAADALQANLASYLDISLTNGGSLNFWIYDWNSIDNSGSLTFEVLPVPEPSTLALLGLGLPFLVAGIWRLISTVISRPRL